MNLTAKQQLSRNPSNAGYATPLKTYSIPATDNPDGTINVPAQPVYGIDPNVEPILMRTPIVITGDPNSGSGNPPGAVQRPASVIEFNGGIAQSGFLSGGANALATMALQEVFKGGVGAEALRTPNTFKTLGLTTAAGDTALWDPAAGKSFRLMGYIIDIAAGTTAAGACIVQIRDNAVVIANHTICGGALAASAGRTIANHVFPSNGYLSVAADNILNLNLSSVLAAGGVTAFAYGTEE